MQTKRERYQQEMMLLPPLESFIPEDHYLRKLNRVLDLSFVHDAVRDRYCQDNGRPSIDPEVLMRLFLIQAMEGIPRVRELMRQVQVNLAYRWFIGYDLDEALPDHSTLSRALDRFGDEVFNELFERSISQCRQSGLIEGRVLHVDATTIRGDVDVNRVGKPGSSDPDARFGRFGDGKKRPGYKQHTVADGGARVVVGLTVTPADRHEDGEAVALVDTAIERLGHPPEGVCADAAYGSGSNAGAMERRGIRFVSPPRKATRSKAEGCFSIEDFEYDQANDLFVCPAGKQLTYSSTNRRRRQRAYVGRRVDCRNCPLREGCTRGQQRSITVSAHHEALVRLRADSKTATFRQLYRTRAPVIEGVFAEAKQWHGLGRAWRRGLRKMRVQCLLVSAVINFKRLMAAPGPLLTSFLLFRAVLKRFLRSPEGIWRFYHESTVLPMTDT